LLFNRPNNEGIYVTSFNQRNYLSQGYCFQFLILLRSLPERAWVAAMISLMVLLLSLSGCSKPTEKQEEIRPVRVYKIASDQADTLAEFPGDVRARVESKLAFRVGGKIVSRKVNVGDTVRPGEILMQLDPQDLKLAQLQANASLQAARGNHDLAEAELKRYRDLRDKNFVSQAVLDSKITAYRAAKASYDQARAAYQGQSNQAEYANLIADAVGVVTSVDAEAGQVVNAGVPVVRVAQTDEKEIVIAIPEDQVDRLRRISDIRVRIWANPNNVIPGVLRELSPIADAATRTYIAKIAIPSASAEVRLGMSAYVTFAAKSDAALIKVPLTALLQRNGATSVWVVENGKVRLVPVRVGGASEDAILIADGLAIGQTIVTAGVNSLRAGQKVLILGNDAVQPTLPSASLVPPVLKPVPTPKNTDGAIK
jgi:multidrug efflux system membrane fusion protein